MKTRHSQ